jgi:hypothetical protein
VEEASDLHSDAAVPRWSCGFRNCEDDGTDILMAEDRFLVASRRQIRAYPVEVMVTELVDTSSPLYERAAVAVGSSDDQAHKEEHTSEAGSLDTVKISNSVQQRRKRRTMRAMMRREQQAAMGCSSVL